LKNIRKIRRPSSKSRKMLQRNIKEVNTNKGMEDANKKAKAGKSTSNKKTQNYILIAQTHIGCEENHHPYEENYRSHNSGIVL
jgi:hypothetical protein